MKVRYNATALKANDALNAADNKVAQSLQRLSTGLKINQAKDDPAGYAISHRMNSQLAGVSSATQNANTGINVVETADGALAEVHDMLQRMNELSVKSATGTMTDADRETVDKEMQQLKEEISRVASDTEFNSQTLLDGSFDLKGYTSDLTIKVGTYTSDVLAKVYTLSSLSFDYDEDGNIDPDSVTYDLGDDFDADATVTVTGDKTLTIKGPNGFEIMLDVDGTQNSYTDLALDITGIGAMTIQIGANEGQTLDVQVPTISLQRLGLTDSNLLTQDDATDAIDAIKGAIQYISDARSQLGAYQNRLEHTVNSLDITTESMTSSYSRLVDTDMAEEMTEYTTNEIVTQAATSMLAQANQRPAEVLQLLQ